MGEAIAHPEYKKFLDWCRQRRDALSRKAITIAENLDKTNRTGHLYRGYLAAVHFLRENPDVQNWLKELSLSKREAFDYDSPDFGPAWSAFIAKHGAKHSVLRHILPTRYGGQTRTGGGGAYPFRVAVRLVAEFLGERRAAQVERVPAKYRMVRKKQFDRDYPEVENLKRVYDYRCQVCQQRVELGPRKYYCEAHHLRPLGRPHGGPAETSNVVILCPNHHAEFDFFLFAILDYEGKKRKLEHMLRKLEGTEAYLMVRHRIAPEHVDYVTEQFLTRLDLMKGT